MSVCWHRPIGLLSVLLILGPMLPSLGMAGHRSRSQPKTATPIKHLVVLFQENKSFDSYFGTYPSALNPPGSPAFHARPGTPSVNGLTGVLLLDNPNSQNPFRIGRLDSYTCDQAHKYDQQIMSYNGGLVNMFVQVGENKGPDNALQFCQPIPDTNTEYYTDMGYFDGNTATALWNYAQHFAMSDNSFAAMVGESSRGAQVLIRGDVSNVVCSDKAGTERVYVPDGNTLVACDGPTDSTSTAAPVTAAGVTGVMVDDQDPFWDVCSRSDKTTAFGVGTNNIGVMLSEAGISWGWFQGGFADCTASHSLEAWDEATGEMTDAILDYVPHWNPFQYYQETANPSHLPPVSALTVGLQDQANHQYDLDWFWKAATAGRLPAISFLKAANYQAGHPSQGDVLDEQVFLVETLNRLQRLPQWTKMAVIIAWDDSDGWYDHVMPSIVNTSATELDLLTDGTTPGCGSETEGEGARCGYGPRLPFFVVSPFAKKNYVSGVLTDQTSILRFIEDNWLEGARVSDTSFDNFAGSIMDMFDFSSWGRRKWPFVSRRLFLDPSTGQPIRRHAVW